MESKYDLGEFQDSLQNGKGETAGKDRPRTIPQCKTGVPSVDLKAVYGPGPERETYNVGTKVPVAVFNSLKQRGEFGEQKFFVGIRSEEDMNYRRSIHLEPGFEYEVRVAYCNNADTSLPAASSSATGTKLRVYFSGSVGPSKRAIVSAAISAENAEPAMIWDCVILQADEKMSISYKIASAKIWNNQGGNGRILPQSLFSAGGTMLGGDKLDGVIQAGDFFSGYVTFTLKTGGECRRRKQTIPGWGKGIQKDSTQNAPIQRMGAKKRSCVSVKIVSPVGKNYCTKDISAAMEEVIPWKVLFTNSASSQDFRIRVTLPSSLKYIANSAVLTGTGLSGLRLSDAWIRGGTSIVNFAGDGEGEIRFKTRYYPPAGGGANLSKIGVEIDTPIVTMRDEASVSKRAE